MKKLDDKIRALEDQHAEQSVEQHLAAFSAEQRDIGLMVLGGVRIAGQISTTVASESFKALIRFGEEKLFEAFTDANGNHFTRMADFLDQSPFSPMSKHAFHDRKALFEKEGEKLFDIFGELGLSIRKRKMLGKGNVEIDGEIVIVHDGDETHEIAITNQTRLLETLTALADANADKSAKLEKQKEKIAKHDDKVRELYTEIDKVKAATAADIEQDAHAMAMITLGLAYREVIRTVEEMNAVEREQFQSVDFERIAAWMSDLSMTFERGSDWTTLMPNETQQPTIQNPQSDDDIIDRALDVSGDNDRELAEKL